jgi:hypothetical protein
MSENVREQHPQGYFYIVPAVLAESGNFYKAMLYGLITSLARKDDNTGCTASNSYLAKKLNMKDPTTISKYVNELKDEGWFNVKLNDKGNVRNIFPLGCKPIPLRFTPKGDRVETEGGDGVETEDSNISISNIKEYLLSMPAKEREKVMEQLGESVSTEEMQAPEVVEIGTYYKEIIGSKLDKTPQLNEKGKQKIAMRLRIYKVEDLKKAIDTFSNDSWWMENNAHRGIVWFFKNNERIEQFINLSHKTRSQTNKTAGNERKYGKF